MKTIILIISFLIIGFISYTQTHETIYALNYGVTTNNVDRGVPVKFGTVKSFPESSYITIKEKGSGSYYIKTIVNAQFAYGHYFKYDRKTASEFVYKRTDGDPEEFIFSNMPLSELARSNKYDEQITIRLVNYRTSFALLLKF